MGNIGKIKSLKAELVALKEGKNDLLDSFKRLEKQNNEMIKNNYDKKLKLSSQQQLEHKNMSKSKEDRKKRIDRKKRSIYCKNKKNKSEGGSIHIYLNDDGKIENMIKKVVNLT